MVYKPYTNLQGKTPNRSTEFRHETLHKYSLLDANNEYHIHFCLVELWAELQTAEKSKNPCCGTGL